MSAVIDGEGRVFGRINLVDAALIMFAVILIPVAYAAFLLFRTPTPRITSVEPAQLTYVEDRAAGGTNLTGKLKVHGTGLRPILRALIGGQPAVAFIFESPTSADVLFGDLPVGTHDLVLLDGVQEVARADKAVTVPAKVQTASARVRVVGHLIDLEEQAARALRVGAKYPPAGAPDAEIVALGDPVPDLREVRLLDGLVELLARGRWQRPAAFVLDCDVSAPLQCRVGQVSLGGSEVLLNVPGSGGALRLRVREVVPADAPRPADVRVRFLAPADAIALMKPGDRDESAPLVDGRAATIISIESRQVVPGDFMLQASTDDAQPPSNIRAGDRVAAIEAVVRLGLDPARDGWRYRSHRVTVGRTLTFATPTYTMRGLVRSVVLSHESPAERR
jgi:hypothetical protein